MASAAGVTAVMFGTVWRVLQVGLGLLSRVGFALVGVV